MPRKKPVSIKRVYDPPAAADGTRVLVDRLWPRGLAKDKAKIDRWLREVAPSNELRRWFGHDPARWQEFCRRYAAELDLRPDALDELVAICRAGPATLLFAAHDTEHNNAVALAALLARRPKRRGG